MFRTGEETVEVLFQVGKCLSKPRGQKVAGPGRCCLSSLKPQLFEVGNVNRIFQIGCGFGKNLVNKLEVSLNGAFVLIVNRRLCRRCERRHLQMYFSFETIADAGSDYGKALGQQSNKSAMIDTFCHGTPVIKKVYFGKATCSLLCR